MAGSGIITVRRGIFLIAYLVLSLHVPTCSPVFSQQQPRPDGEFKPDSNVLRLDENRYRIGNVTIDKALGEISVPGRVNMIEGAVEYLSVTPSGKIHESVLTLDLQPLHLQLAMLLLGLEFGQNLQFQGDSSLATGDRVALRVSWLGTKGKRIEKSASDLVLNLKTGKAMDATDWVFTGSRTIEGRLQADLDGSLIAVYNDPNAILNNPLEGRGDDTTYGANRKALPAVGTEITLLIRAPRKEK